jgi:polyhydroxybutyrate depolymerase
MPAAIGTPDAPAGDVPDAPAAPGEPDGRTLPGEVPDAGELPVDAAVDAGIDPACAAPTWTPGTDQTVTVRSGDRDRRYVVHVGASVVAGEPTPLLVNFHGHRNTPAIQALFSQMNPLADREGFIVIYPEGIATSFNGAGCCGDALEQDIDDVGFTRALVADAVTKVCVDRRRIYATGFSNGGFMAHRLACETADLFAAFAPVSGGNEGRSCAPSRPVPIIGFHGDGDTVIRYSTGERAMRGWAERNGCAGEPVREMFGRSYCDRWTRCRGGVAVELCTDVGGWHLWPSARTAHPASPAIWEFLTRYQRPE